MGEKKVAYVEVFGKITRLRLSVDRIGRRLMQQRLGGGIHVRRKGGL